MKFVCPRCSGVSMKISLSIELPPDSHSDEIAVQILKCLKCGFAGLGVYEESRRGRLDSESVGHRGYYVDDVTLASIEKMIIECPTPKKFGCHREVHRLLGRTNEVGRLDLLKEISNKERFKLQMVH